MFVVAIVFCITKQRLRLKKIFLLKRLYSFCFHVVLKFYFNGLWFKNNNDLEKFLRCE
jgi:hypothetical protein